MPSVVLPIAARAASHAKVTERRACGDFAECTRDLVDTHYPKAERIRVVLDNLSTHTASAFVFVLPALFFAAYAVSLARRA